MPEYSNPRVRKSGLAKRIMLTEITI